MAQSPVNLAPFYKGWDAHNALLIDAIAPLTAEQLAWQAPASMGEIWRIVSHIVSARVTWFHEVMGEGEAALEQYRSWLRGADARSAEDLVGALQETWALIEGCLARWTPGMLDDEFTRQGRERTWTMTRQWVIWHVLEHDIHHGGETSLVLGTNGLSGLDL